MSQSAYRTVPKSLKYWKCTSCDLLNPLFDSRCVACYQLQKFDDKAKSQLIKLCKTYCDESSTWNKLPDNAFKVDTLTKALTNKLYKIEVIDDFAVEIDKKYKCGVLRIFNHRINLSLDQLLSVYSSFASSNIGTPIFGNFDIGQIEQFIIGRDLNDKELIENKQLSNKIANILSQIHRLKPKCFDNRQSVVAINLAKNASKAIEIFETQVNALSDIKKWQFALQNEEDSEQKLDGKLFGDIIKREREELIHKIESSNSFFSQLCFSHNDYHSGNMIMVDKTDNKDDNKSNDEYKIIDYEYSGYNYRMFDFGNFFNELMIDNYYENAPYFKIDVGEFPTKEYRKRFIKEYVKGLGIMDMEMDEVDDDKLDKWVNDIELGCMLSHLWWSMWGIVESQRNDIDWNYMEYARQRLYHFFRVKQMYND